MKKGPRCLYQCPINQPSGLLLVHVLEHVPVIAFTLMNISPILILSSSMVFQLKFHCSMQVLHLDSVCWCSWFMSQCI